MLTSGKISYEIGGNVEATPFGGLFAMHRLVTRLGLVLTLANSVLTGGTRLEDVDRLRTDVPLINGLGARLLPDPTTTGDFLRRFTEADVLVLMDAINSVGPALWRGRGADVLGDVVYLDVHGTIVATRARRHNHKKQIIKERKFLNLDLNYEDVAEFTYRPGRCQRGYRVVVVRKHAHRHSPGTSSPGTP